MQGSPYTSMGHVVRDVLRNEGISAFYRSFTTSLLMNVPFHMAYLTTYEVMRKALHPDDGKELCAWLYAMRFSPLTTFFSALRPSSR